MVSLAWRHYPNGAANISLMIDDALYTLLALVAVALVAVVYFMSRNRYRATLQTHASRFFASERQLDKSQKKFIGSMQAEELVMRVLEEEGWRHVFLRRRVPISRLGHNREIDAIAVGNVILVVEVKHWRGYVWSNGRSWFQAPNYANFIARQKERGKQKAGSGKGDYVAAPATMEFEDVKEDNVEKAAGLRRYIENTRRIALPDFKLMHEESVANASEQMGPEGTLYSDAALHKYCGKSVVPVVVFTNPAVCLDPVTLKRERYVFTLDTFRVFARETLRGNVSADSPNAVAEGYNRVRSFLHYHSSRVLRQVPLLGGLVRRSAAEGYLLDADEQEDVAHAVDILRTWDIIFLHDGRMLTGDVVKVDAPTANCMYERKHLLDVNIRWNDSAVVGMAKTFLMNEAGSVELVLTTAKRMAIKKKENKPRDAKGNIRFPIRPRKHHNMNLNDRIFIKPAGSPGEPHVHALIDIKEVRLSHHLYESERLL